MNESFWTALIVASFGLMIIGSKYGSRLLLLTFLLAATLDLLCVIELAGFAAQLWLGIAGLLLLVTGRAVLRGLAWSFRGFLAARRVQRREVLQLRKSRRSPVVPPNSAAQISPSRALPSDEGGDTPWLS